METPVAKIPDEVLPPVSGREGATLSWLEARRAGSVSVSETEWDKLEEAITGSVTDLLLEKFLA